MAIHEVLKAVAEILVKTLPAGATIDGPLDNGTSLSVLVKLPEYDHPQIACRVSMQTQGQYRYDHTRPQADVRDRIAVQPYYPNTLAGKRFAVANVEKAAAYALEATEVFVANENSRRDRKHAIADLMRPFRYFLRSRVLVEPERYGTGEVLFSNSSSAYPIKGRLGSNSGKTVDLALMGMSPKTARLIVTAICAALEEPQDVPDLF